MAKGTPLAERFWSRVRAGKPDECWLWVGRLDHYGYGRIGTKEYGPDTKAHRLAWMLHADEPVPPGMVVCHSCDNPACVNPAHLWLGTQGQNMADKVAKGRARGPYSGETHCRNGHPFQPYPTTRNGKQRRYCPVCRKAADHARYLRKKAQA